MSCAPAAPGGLASCRARGCPRAGGRRASPSSRSSKMRSRPVRPHPGAGGTPSSRSRARRSAGTGPSLPTTDARGRRAANCGPRRAPAPWCRVRAACRGSACASGGGNRSPGRRSGEDRLGSPGDARVVGRSFERETDVAAHGAEDPGARATGAPALAVVHRLADARGGRGRGAAVGAREGLDRRALLRIVAERAVHAGDVPLLPGVGEALHHLLARIVAFADQDDGADERDGRDERADREHVAAEYGPPWPGGRPGDARNAPARAVAARGCSPLGRRVASEAVPQRRRSDATVSRPRHHPMTRRCRGNPLRHRAALGIHDPAASDRRLGARRPLAASGGPR